MAYNFDSLVSVSGKGGLFHMVANRSNGLILEDLSDGKKSFFSSRIHQFTPLGSIGIYTDDDSLALKDVFNRMKNSEVVVPEDKLDQADQLTAYFEQILPEYDRDKVKLSDIKKVLKWFLFIKSKDMLSVLEEEEKKEESTPEEK